MRQPILFVSMIVAFGLGVGYYVARQQANPYVGQHVIGGNVQMMHAPVSGTTAPHLYLRRTLHLTQRPISAWLELVGHDSIRVYVNGRAVASERPKSTASATGMVLDITSHIRAGKNSIAISVREITQSRRPGITVRGQCVLANGTAISLDGGDQWRASQVYDRRGFFWYQTDFPDDHWRPAQLGREQLAYATVPVTPSAIETVFDPPWITPTERVDDRLVIAGTIHLEESQESEPRVGAIQAWGPAWRGEAWMRLVTTAPYRLAINGQVIADDRFDVGDAAGYRAKRVSYDLSDVLRVGDNTVAIAFSQFETLPHVRADFRWQDAAGKVSAAVMDQSWRMSTRRSTDWLNPRLSSLAGWVPCQIDHSQSVAPPWATLREYVTVPAPSMRQYERIQRAMFAAVIAMVFAWLGSWLVGRSATRLAKQAHVEVTPQLASLAVIPPTLVAVTVAVMDFDPTYATWTLFRWDILVGMFVSVVAQWFLILFLAVTWTSGRRVLPSGRAFRSFGTITLTITILVIAGWLRISTITTEPIHHDEVGAYWKAVGVLEYGLPAGQSHPDLPFGVVATSELVYYPMALTALMFDDPLLVIRLPAVFFSLATLLLLVYVTTRCFGASAGLLAGVLFAFSPHIIAMSTFGRYFAQLQFFTLLTTYWTFRAVHTHGPIHRGYLWGAMISFVLMYLSWEGSGLLAIPLVGAVLWLRRNRMRQLWGSPSLYAASGLAISVALFQNSHRLIQQTQRLWYGSGISSLSLKPMWRFPLFDPERYLIESSWTRCALIPIVLLGVAVAMAFYRRWDRRLQFLVIAFVGTALLMGVFLPLNAGRYSYHLTVLLLIIAVVPVASAARAIRQLAVGDRVPGWARAYAATISTLGIAALVVIGSGQWIRMQTNPTFMSRVFDVDQRRSPDWRYAVEFLRNHMQDDDAVIAIYPHAIEHTMHMLNGNSRTIDEHAWRADYWLQTTLLLQASLGDDAMIPRDRRSGAPMISNLAQLQRIFAEHDRVWYLTTRYGQNRINDRQVSEYLRRNMDVVYEDYVTTVLCRDLNHRPAGIQWEDDQAGKVASDLYFK